MSHEMPKDSIIDFITHYKSLIAIIRFLTYMACSGQAAIHIACMTLAVQWATDAMGPDQLREVLACCVNFHYSE